MKLISLQFGNFFRYLKSPKLPLDGQGLVLIEGENRDDVTADSNGAGKSTIFDAITYSLFGDTVRGFRADDVVNEKVGKDCFVSLAMRDDNGVAYTIDRYRRHSEYKNKLILKGGKKDYSTLDADATQGRIEELMGMDFDTFLNAALFGQGVTRHFPAMTDKEQKVIMDKLVGVTMLRGASNAANEMNAAIEEEMEGVAVDPEDVIILEEEIKELEVARNSWKDERVKRAQRIEDEIAALKANAHDVKKAEEALHDAVEVRKAAVADANAASMAGSNAETILAEHRAAARVASEKALALKREVDAADKLKPGTKCRHCGAEITIKTQMQHKTSLLAELQQASEADEKADSRVVTWKKQVEEHRQATEIKQRAAERTRQEESDAREALTLAKTTAARLKSKQEDLANVRAEVWGATKMLEKKVERLKAMNEKIKSSAKKLEELAIKKRHVAFIGGMFSDKGVDGAPPLKGLIFDSVTPFLNTQVAHYSKYLTAGNIAIEFSTQSVLKSGATRDRFEVTAVNKNGSSVYGGQSGGERRKVDICAALALQRLAASRARAQLNIAFYDEMFEALDDTGCDAVMELLTAESKRYSSLFVITHQEGLKASFPRSWLVVKEKGVSKIAVT